jgi:hypothetical protein
MDAKNVINGTFGEVWLDSDKVGECKGLQAKLDFRKEDVNIPMKMGKETKVIGWEGKGSLKLHKVSSRLAIKLRDLVKNGVDVRFTVISKLADPDAYGAERIAVKYVSFDDLTLADWETAKIGEVEAPFTFSDYDFLDEIQPV